MRTYQQPAALRAGYHVSDIVHGLKSKPAQAGKLLLVVDYRPQGEERGAVFTEIGLSRAYGAYHAAAKARVRIDLNPHHIS